MNNDETREDESEDIVNKELMDQLKECANVLANQQNCYAHGPNTLSNFSCLIVIPLSPHFSSDTSETFLVSSVISCLWFSFFSVIYRPFSYFSCLLTQLPRYFVSYPIDSSHVPLFCLQQSTPSFSCSQPSFPLISHIVRCAPCDPRPLTKMELV